MDAASALDQPGSAGTLAVRLSVAVALAVAGLTLVFVLFEQQKTMSSPTRRTLPQRHPGRKPGN